MRSAPVLLLVLLIAVGLGLGLRVMLRAPIGGPSGGPSGAHGASGEQWPASIAGVPQGHVYTGVVEEPADVDPYTCNHGAAWRFVLGFTHECLLDVDPVSGALRGALAESFEPAADGMSCTFVLRDGVRFADGSPLTMADVLFGWDLARAGHLPMGLCGDAFDRVASAEAIDEQRLRVVFRERHYAAVQAVGESWIVGKKQFFVDRVTEHAKNGGEPVPAVDSAEFARLLGRVVRECGPGTGPYALPSDGEGPVTWHTRQDLLLVRNPHCWRRTATPGTWNFAGIRLLFRDPATVPMAVRSRDVDWYSSPAVDDLVAAEPELLHHYRRLSYDHRMLGAFLFVWNCRHENFARPEVRRALAMLFDLDAVLEKFGGNGAKAKAFAKPESLDYPNDIESPPFDPAEARRQLRAAGFAPEDGRPLKLTLLTPQAYAAMTSTVELFVDACKRAGVDLEVRSPEWTSYLEQVKRDEWDALFIQQSFRPWADPYEFVHSGGGSNDGGWSCTEADDLVTAIRTELDLQRRSELLHRLHTLVQREQPVTFLVHPKVTLLLNAQVQNALTGPCGLGLEHAFVAAEAQRK